MTERTYRIAKRERGQTDTCIDEIRGDGSRMPVLSLPRGTPGTVSFEVTEALGRAYRAGREDRSGELLPGAEAFLDDMAYLYAHGAARGIEQFAKERRRQIEGHGYDARHDDVAMGTSLCRQASWELDEAEEVAGSGDHLRVKAGALIAADLDRSDRLALEATRDPRP